MATNDDATGSHSQGRNTENKDPRLCPHNSSCLSAQALPDDDQAPSELFSVSENVSTAFDCDFGIALLDCFAVPDTAEGCDPPSQYAIWPKPKITWGVLMLRLSITTVMAC